MPPEINHSICLQCIGCIAVCPTAALTYDGSKITFDARKCVGCRNCFRVCPAKAIKWRSKN